MVKCDGVYPCFFLLSLGQIDSKSRQCLIILSAWCDLRLLCLDSKSRQCLIDTAGPFITNGLRKYG